MLVRSLSALLVFLLTTSFWGYGQNYVFNRLSIADGLLSNNIKSVWQDADGYLWIGSTGGLQRYDGTMMRTALSDRVDQVLSDSDHRVWVRCGTRIGLFDTATFSVTYIPYEQADKTFNPTRIWLRKDARGNAFIVLTGKNYQYFDEKQKCFTSSRNPFQLPDSLRITDVVEDVAANRFWVLAQNGFGYWDHKTRSLHTALQNPSRDPLLANPSTPSVVSRLYLDRDQRIWMATANSSRFLCFDNTKKKYTADTLGLGNPESDLFEVYGFSTYHDSVAIAYGHNYFRAKQENGFQDLTALSNTPYGIHFNSVSSVFEDKEGILWVATDNGLFYSSSSRHKYIHVVLSQEKQRGAISSFLEDGDGQLWIGTWGRGIFVMKDGPEGSEIAPVNELVRYAQFPWSISFDNKQRIWIGCEQGRLVSYDPSLKKVAVHQPAVFGNSAVRQIVKDDEGQLWVGLQNGNLFVFDPLQPFDGKSMQPAKSLGGPVNRLVFSDRHHLLAAVNGKGIVMIDTRTGKTINSVDMEKARTVLIAGIRDILPVNDTICLIASEKLGTLNMKTFRPDFAFLNNQLKGASFTLQKDRQHQIWIGSSEGISRLDPVAGLLTRYTQDDGLLTVHNNSYVPERSIALSDGRLAFGGNQHMVVFNPEEYRESVLPPKITITGLSVNDRYLPADSLARLSVITLPYTHTTLGIDFAALSFLNKNRISYEYMLEGHDKEWIIATSAPRVRYHFLPHGKYRFLVRAKNEQGEYSPDITSLNLKIEPPFWKTLWFYALIVLSGAAILFYLHRLRLQKLLHVEKVRNRLARDLHDDMGSTLSTINILSNMALQQESADPGKSKQYLDTISKSTHQMMEAMDDIVWSINPANDSMAKILARMKETAGSVLEPAQINYRFEVDPDVPELYLSMEVRREIFLIFKEALNNIVKYAACSFVLFKLFRKTNELILIIEDDGLGFDMPATESAVRGNGLKNMRTRAANAKGKILIDSLKGKGTCLTLSVPIA